MRPRLMLAVMAVGLLVAALLVAGWPRHQTPAADLNSIPAAPPATTASTPTPPPSAARPSASISPSRSPDRLEGRALATVWLTGYLTRSTRDDDRWVAAVRDLTSPDLLTELESEGPDAVGLFRLTQWRVTAVTPYAARERPVDTPSRRVLAYTATVTDGRTTEHKPFLLYAYLSPNNRWLVTLVEQPYTSEG